VRVKLNKYRISLDFKHNSLKIKGESHSQYIAQILTKIVIAQIKVILLIQSIVKLFYSHLNYETKNSHNKDINNFNMRFFRFKNIVFNISHEYYLANTSTFNVLVLK